jgi:acetate---CoA ligase (ADP-forming) subunit beta
MHITGVEAMDKNAALTIINTALKQGRTMLSEFESKQVLGYYDIPVTREMLVAEFSGLESAVNGIGYPLVIKGCSADIAHKTEKNLIRLDIRHFDEAVAAFGEIHAAMEGSVGGVLVQEMISGRRELVMGMTRDVQFGPCVMFGLGGIFTEVFEDVSFRKAPLDTRDAFEMMQEIRGCKILEPIRGMEAADASALADILIRVGRIGLDMDAVAEIDINPVIISGSRPVAADALIGLRPQ